MKTSGRAFATTLLAAAASVYAVTSNAGPHGGATAFHGMSGSRFPATYGIAGTGSQQNGIAGTGSQRRGIAGTGSQQNGIAGTGSHQNGIAGTGSRQNGIAGTGSERLSAGHPSASQL
jgi:hypothetical protein